MKNQITLSKDLHLTYEAITRRIAIMGMSGSGKSNTACVLVENLLTIGAQTVILDNDGTWYGLRLGADGKSKGFDIPVFGGLHGDYPLDFRSGSLVASVIVENNLSCVLDVSDFRKGQRRQFATDLAEQMFHLKKSHKTPMMFVIEEAQEFIPQRVGKEEARMVGAFEDITKGGRKYGIGSTIISQRPQAINKDALNQCEILIAHYTYGIHERKALADWIVDKNQSVDLVDELTTLKEGQAYLWSPRWLKEMRKVQIYKKSTFDAAMTPKFGEKAIATSIGKMELDKIAGMMSEVIKTAQENDPSILKRRITELEKQLRKPAVQQEVKIERVEVPVIPEKDIQSLIEVVNILNNHADKIVNTGEYMQGFCKSIESMIENVKHPVLQYSAKQVRVVPAIKREPSVTVDPNKPTGGELKILTICAQYPDGVDRDQLMAFADYRNTSITTFTGTLLRKGLISKNGAGFKITEIGYQTLGDFDPLPTGDELRSYWHNRLSGGERGVFDEVVAAYPNPVYKSELEEKLNYKTTSITTFVGNLARKRLIVSFQPGTIQASDNLF